MDKVEKREKIQSLNELRLQQEKLKMEMRITRTAIFNSIGNTSNATKDYVVNTFLIPAGLTTLATFVLTKWFTDDDDAEPAAEGEDNEDRPDNPIRDLIRSIAEYVLAFYKGENN